MKEIEILDCTLRDGGYINDWKFGLVNIRTTTSLLAQSGIDYIECGYLSSSSQGQEESTLYENIEHWKTTIKTINPEQQYALMIDCGHYPVEEIPKAEYDNLIIRISFHKRDMDKALEQCRYIKERGYKVFVQSMVTSDYSTEEYIELLEKINILDPCCFYIVDSFGLMGTNEMEHYLSLSDMYLNETIKIGYHSHNNMQQAFANAQYMINKAMKHDIIIDGSIYGMGRGAGNLNLELIVEYLRINKIKVYNSDYIIEILNDVIMPIYEKKTWGYSPYYFLSAKHNCHPNYALFYQQKKRTDIGKVEQIFRQMKTEEKLAYKVEIAERYYKQYMENMK